MFSSSASLTISWGIISGLDVRGKINQVCDPPACFFIYFPPEESCPFPLVVICSVNSVLSDTSKDVIEGVATPPRYRVKAIKSEVMSLWICLSQTLKK